MDDFIIAESNLPFFVGDCLERMAEFKHSELSMIERCHLLTYLRQCIKQHNEAINAVFNEGACAEHIMIDISLEALRMWFWELYNIELFVEWTPAGCYRFFGTTEPEREYVQRVRERAHQP